MVPGDLNRAQVYRTVSVSVLAPTSRVNHAPCCSIVNGLAMWSVSYIVISLTYAYGYALIPCRYMQSESVFEQ